MSKVWKVKVDEKEYEVKLKGSRVLVNNEKFKLRNLLVKHKWFQTTYGVDIGTKKAMLIISSLIGGTKLVIDEKDCATGEIYVPVHIPKWAYVFMALHMINLINGLLGAIIGLIGCSATVSISSNKKIHIVARVALDIVVLVLTYIIVIGIVLALAQY
ncbi:hypothetical protein [Clostridium sp. E02]|uniref:hypothetical protein n=1 Tax=Clostridium sp. E02 TaxID=2487134 RepID=UPI000F535371|nr:hypothetical protein [Clostridium sp. E02]